MARILVMDDDSITRQFLRDVLEKIFKHTVLEASTVEQALNIARSQTTEMMLLDQNLPDGTALEFCQSLEQCGCADLIPKWIVTGEKPADWDASFWARFHVRGLLVKPIKINDVKALLEVTGSEKTG